MGLEERMKNERIVVLNDHHIPYMEDKKTLSAVANGVRAIKPDTIVLAGDVCDFYNISHFDKEPDYDIDFREEVKACRTYLKKLRKDNKTQRIVFIKGNHEQRLEKYVRRNAPQLHWVDDVTVPGILKLEDLEIEWTDKRYWEHKGIVFSHLNRSNKYGGYTAKNLGQDLRKHLVHGHSHKTGHVAIGDAQMYDNGCLCDTGDVEYLEAPHTWSQAFMVIDVVNGAPYFHQIPIQDHKFVWNGYLYTPKGRKKI